MIPPEIEARARAAISYRALRDHFEHVDGRTAAGTTVSTASCPLAVRIAQEIGPSYQVSVTTTRAAINRSDDEKDVVEIPLTDWQREVVRLIDAHGHGFKRRIRVGKVRQILEDMYVPGDEKEPAHADHD